MKSKYIVLNTLFFLLPLYIYGQKNDTIPWGGNQIIRNGATLFDEGKYKEAIDMYQRVSKVDPQYPTACYEMALTYENMEEYQKGLLKCIESDSLEPDQVRTVTLRGSLLDDLGRRKESIALLENGRKKWPYNQNLLYNLALVYINNNEYTKAESLLIESIKIAPYHAASHINLGRLNYLMGRKAEAYLAYNMGLVMNTSTRNLNKFERIITGENDTISKPYLYPYTRQSDALRWKELTQLLNSNIAFRNDFPYPGKANYLIARQSYLLFQKMEFDTNEFSLYNQFYVRFFKEVMTENEFDALTNYQLQNVEDKKIGDWSRSNKSKMDKFINHAKSMINEWREYNFSTSNEAKRMKTWLYDEDGDLSFIGIQFMNDKPSREGEYIRINGNGSISEKGTYKNDVTDGNRVILWPDGSVKQQLFDVEGKLHGINKTFYPNGKLSGIYPRVKGEQEGTEIEYSKSGKVFRKQSFVQGKAEGPDYNTYYSSGYTSTSEYKNNQLNGPFSEMWLNGSKKEEGVYKDSLLNGPFKTWYTNGKPASVKSYKNNFECGAFTEYYPNGMKKEEGVCNDSAQYVGTYTTFNREGKVDYTSTGYVNGKQSGVQTNYYPNGNKLNEYYYENNQLTKLISYAPNGQIIYQAEPKEGVLHAKLYYFDGMLHYEGDYQNGRKSGLWHEYSGGGIVINEANYINGDFFGPQKTYYPSGILKTSFTCDSDKIEGPYREYAANGKLKILSYYHKGMGTGEYRLYHSNDSLAALLYQDENNVVGRRFDFTPEGHLSGIIDYDENGNYKQISELLKGELLSSTPYNKDSITVQNLYSNGKLLSKFTLIDGRKEGLWSVFYPNGKLMAQQNYIKGLKNGASKTWDADGVLTSNYNYLINKLEGTCFHFQNGKMESKELYEEGENQGDFCEYYPSGKLYRRIHYVDDQKVGEYQFYSPDSVLLASLNYENNNCTAVTIRNKEGKLVRLECTDPAANHLTSYYPNGAVAATVPIQKGYFDGPFTLYKADGKTLRLRNFKDNYLEGLVESYYDNGKILESMHYKNDELEGSYVRYSATGTKVEEGQYLAGGKNGCWNYYDAMGKLKYRLYYENDQLYDMR